MRRGGNRRGGAPAAAAAAAAKPQAEDRANCTGAATGSGVAKGALKLYLHDAFVVSRELVTVPDRVIHVDGVVRPYVPGQHVT